MRWIVRDGKLYTAELRGGTAKALIVARMRLGGASAVNEPERLPGAEGETGKGGTLLRKP